jgi:hypothetical protein
MTFKKFVDNIDKIYADQGDKPESERLRYGQILMNQLWYVWPAKYHKITMTQKDPFHNDGLVKDLLYDLEGAWPACPVNLNKDQVRIQRLEKKIKKLQASNKRHKDDLKHYEKIFRGFPWIESSYQRQKEYIELKKTVAEKNWTIRGLQDALNVVGLISEDNLNQFKGLYEDFKVNGRAFDKYLTSGYEDNLVLLGKIISIVSSMKKYAKDVEWRKP